MPWHCTGDGLSCVGRHGSRLRPRCAVQILAADVEAMQSHVLAAPEATSANYRSGVPRARRGGLMAALGGGDEDEGEVVEGGEPPAG
jgi:hypothetical protein